MSWIALNSLSVSFSVKIRSFVLLLVVGGAAVAELIFCVPWLSSSSSSRVTIIIYHIVVLYPFLSLSLSPARSHSIATRKIQLLIIKFYTALYFERHKQLMLHFCSAVTHCSSNNSASRMVTVEVCCVFVYMPLIYSNIISAVSSRLLCSDLDVIYGKKPKLTGLSVHQDRVRHNVGNAK